MTEWIKVVTGAAMSLPLLALMFLVAWDKDEVSFFEFAKIALGLAGGFFLFFGLPILAAHGVLMIWGAFQ